MPTIRILPLPRRALRVVRLRPFAAPPIVRAIVARRRRGARLLPAGGPLRRLARAAGRRRALRALLRR